LTSGASAAGAYLIGSLVWGGFLLWGLLDALLT
jgi:hypothetical protein